MAFGLIVLAEDDPVVRCLYGEVLETHGYYVLTASNGSECLDVVEQNSRDPRAVILDVRMPKKSGIDTCKHLRQEMEYLGPIIFLTGADDPNTVQACLAAGGDDYILKATEPKGFLKRVNRVIAGHDKKKAKEPA